MSKKFVARASITISAAVSAVWDSLVNPATIKKYMFGTEVVSDWKENSSISWNGVWQGKVYQDKGTILKNVPGKFLQYTHFSPLSGALDLPENYHTLTFELTEKDASTEIKLSQDNNASEEDQKHSEKMYESMFQGLKKMLEQ